MYVELFDRLFYIATGGLAFAYHGWAALGAVIVGIAAFDGVLWLWHRRSS